MSKLKETAKQVAQAPTPKIEQIKDITPAKNVPDQRGQGKTPGIS
jgi:hypothetical protein